MAWNDDANRGRYEVIFTGDDERPLHDFCEERAARLGMTMPKYLKAIARAVMLLEDGDRSLASLLGVEPGEIGTVPSRPKSRSKVREAKPSIGGMDSLLDQME